MVSHLSQMYQFNCMSSYFMLIQDKNNGKCRDCNIRADIKMNPCHLGFYLVLLADHIMYDNEQMVLLKLH